MVFRLIDTIEQVKQAGFSDDSLVYRDKSGNVVSNDGNGAKVIARGMKNFRSGMSLVFCFTNEKDLQVYKKGELIRQLEGPFSPIHFFNNGDSVVVLKKGPEGGRYCRLDVALNTVPFDWDNSFVEDIKSNYFFAREGQTFSCHQLSDGKELWKRDVYEMTGESEGDVLNDLILNGDRLFMSLVNGIVLCLEVTTGKTIEKIPFDKGRIKLYEGMIYGVGGREVGVLNPETLQWHTIDFSAALKEQGFRLLANRFVPQGDELYFEDEKTPVVGVVKLSTQELLWHTKIPIGEGNYWIEDMNANGGKLYVLAQGGTLHIFEKSS